MSSPPQMQAMLDRQAAALLHEFVVQSGISLAMMTAVSVGLGWFVAGRVLRPLRTITTTARTISAGNLHERLALSGPHDELKELGDTFDELLGRLQSSFDAQRHFAANVSHELRTPLTRARTLLEVARTDPRPTIEGLQQAIDRALVASRHQERLIEALLTLARSERATNHSEPLDLRTMVQDTLLALEPQAQNRGLSLDAALDPAPAWGDPRLIERLITNLVDNAIRYNAPDGRVQVTTTTRDGHAVLSVANSGPIIAPHDVHRLMQPFQRLTPDRVATRDGHGLGLAIVRAITNAHDAHLTARPQHTGGLEVEIAFPEPARSAFSTKPARVPSDL
jgi:signal transduction histidine kinase